MWCGVVDGMRTDERSMTGDPDTDPDTDTDATSAVLSPSLARRDERGPSFIP